MTWEKNVRKVVPYIPGEQPKDRNIIKLNTNEFPYPPAPGVEKALQNMNFSDFRLYPDPECDILVAELAEYYKVNKNQVFVGVGSDDVLAMSFLTFFNSGKPILFPDITYSFYDVWANLYNVPYVEIMLDDKFELRTNDYLQENGGIIIPNPNAPTGVLETVENLEYIIKNNRNSIVIIDEAYIDFGGESCISLVEKYDNLLVVQTFSKSRAMAGMRIGFAIGNEKLISYLKDVKYSFNSYTMNYPSLVLGVEAVKDNTYFKETVGKIVTTRERMKRELKELGFEFTDSYSNFLFITHPKHSMKNLFEASKKEGIYVRYWNKSRIDNYLRVSIGTDDEMDKFVDFLKQYLSNNE